METPNSITESTSSRTKISSENICSTEKSQFYSEISDRLKKIAIDRFSSVPGTVISSGTGSESGYIVTGLDSIVKDDINHQSSTNSPKSAISSSSASSTPTTSTFSSSSSSSSAGKQNFNSSTVSSIDLNDIPFIDEDNESVNEINFHVKETITPQELVRLIERIFQNKSKEHLRLLPDNVIKTFVDNVTFSKLDEIFMQYLDNYDQVWLKIAAVFELANRAVNMIDNNPFYKYNSNRIDKIKETTANFIHHRFCDWICENGGWVNEILN